MGYSGTLIDSHDVGTEAGLYRGS